LKVKLEILIKQMRFLDHLVNYQNNRVLVALSYLCWGFTLGPIARSLSASVEYFVLYQLKFPIVSLMWSKCLCTGDKITRYFTTYIFG